MSYREPPKAVTIADALGLAELGRDLLVARHAAPVARRLCEAVRAVIGADGATFVLAEGDDVFYAEEDAIGALWKGRRFPATACISGWAVTNRATVAIEDIYDDERIPVEAYRPTFVKSLAMTPMMDGERVWGAMGAYWSTQHRADERELWLLEQLASMAGGALSCALDAESVEERGRSDGRTVDEDADPEAYAARLLAVVAHDLRDPLSTIQSAVKLLREARDPAGEEAVLVGAVERSAARATSLVSRVLESARVAEGQLSLRLERTRLDALCRSVVEELGADGRVLVEHEEVEALCDAGMLRQALANLVRNALQHGDPDAPVTLRLGRLGDAGTIEVHNHGDPIAVEHRDDLFRPFRRYASDAGGGSLGLGLYITEEIVRAHGGAIDVRSSPEEGTAFSVRLPLGATMVPPPPDE